MSKKPKLAFPLLCPRCKARLESPTGRADSSNYRKGSILRCRFCNFTCTAIISTRKKGPDRITFDPC